MPRRAQLPLNSLAIVDNIVASSCHIYQTWPTLRNVTRRGDNQCIPYLRSPGCSPIQLRTECLALQVADHALESLATDSRIAILPNKPNLTGTNFCYACSIDEDPFVGRVVHDRDGTPSGHQRRFSPTKLPHQTPPEIPNSAPFPQTRQEIWGTWWGTARTALVHITQERDREFQSTRICPGASRCVWRGDFSIPR